jgi:hypothetical protein
MIADVRYRPIPDIRQWALSATRRESGTNHNLPPISIVIAGVPAAVVKCALNLRYVSHSEVSVSLIKLAAMDRLTRKLERIGSLDDEDRAQIAALSLTIEEAPRLRRVVREGTCLTASAFWSRASPAGTSMLLAELGRLFLSTSKVISSMCSTSCFPERTTASKR